LLRQRLASNGIKVVAVTWRGKSLVSTIRKRQKKAPESLAMIADLAGVRVVCPYLHELDKALHLIRDLFRVEKIDTIAPTAAASETGYASYHCLVRWNPDYDGPLTPDDFVSGSHNKEVDDKCRQSWDEQRGPPNEHMRTLLFEIQIRTLLQHAWAEISREFFYEREKAIPESVQVRLRELAILLQDIDASFAAEIDGACEYGVTASSHPQWPAGRLTIEYLQEYSRRVLDQDLSDEHATDALQYANESGLRTIAEFECLMLSSLDAVTRGFDAALVRDNDLLYYLMALRHWVMGAETTFVSLQERTIDRHRTDVNEEMLQQVMSDIETRRSRAD